MSKNSSPPAPANDHKASLEIAISSITETHGAGSIMRLGDAQAAVAVQTISTGSISLDCALGVGGMPRGRVCEIFGPESSGKTTLMPHMIANAQKAGGLTEAAFDITFGAGVNRYTDLLDTATEAGIVNKKGAWYQYESELVGQGRDASASALAGNPELARKINDAVFALKVRHTVPAEQAAEPPEMPEQELAETAKE